MKLPRRKYGILIASGLLVIGLVTAFYALAPNTPATLPLPTAKWRTVFSDEFSAPALDSTKWTTCYEWYDAAYQGCSNTGNNESQWYRKEQVSVQDGQAHFKAVRQDTPGWHHTYEQSYPYRSGMITTGRPSPKAKPLWAGTYGYYEAKLKVPGGQSIWPAFWLLPADHTWPPEIDIMELLGNHPDQILATYHWSTDGKPAKDSSTITTGDVTRGWHVFGLNWQPGQIDWYMDGRLIKTATGREVPSKPMTLVINLAIGGNLPGKPTAATPASTDMFVDYVRVKQLQK